MGPGPAQRYAGSLHTRRCTYKRHSGCTVESIKQLHAGGVENFFHFLSQLIILPVSESAASPALFYIPKGQTTVEIRWESLKRASLHKAEAIKLRHTQVSFLMHPKGGLQSSFTTCLTILFSQVCVLSCSCNVISNKMVLVIQNADNAHISHLSPSLPRCVEAKRTWQRLSETERDKVFILPVEELFGSAASLIVGEGKA